MSQISRMTVPVHRTYFSVTEQPDDCSSPHNGLQCHRAAGWLFQSTERTLMSQISRTTVPVRMTVPVHRTYFSVTEQPEDRFSPQYFKCPVRSAALWWWQQASEILALSRRLMVTTVHKGIPVTMLKMTVTISPINFPENCQSSPVAGPFTLGNCFRCCTCPFVY